MKIVIAIAFVLILFALGVAGASMLRGGRQGQARPGTMMRALAWRVGLSVFLFVLLLVAYGLGGVRPTGLPLNG
jgi:hypothetical protein